MSPLICSDAFHNLESESDRSPTPPPLKEKKWTRNANDVATEDEGDGATDAYPTPPKPKHSRHRAKMVQEPVTSGAGAPKAVVIRGEAYLISC
jgi:hypothetical protein